MTWFQIHPGFSSKIPVESVHLGVSSTNPVESDLFALSALSDFCHDNSIKTLTYMSKASLSRTIRNMLQYPLLWFQRAESGTCWSWIHMMIRCFHWSQTEFSFAHTDWGLTVLIWCDIPLAGYHNCAQLHLARSCRGGHPCNRTAWGVS